MKKGKNNSLNTKTIKDYYRRSQDNLTSGQFAPDNFVSHFKLDNFASEKIALFFLRRGMFINSLENAIIWYCGKSSFTIWKYLREILEGRVAPDAQDGISPFTCFHLWPVLGAGTGLLRIITILQDNNAEIQNYQTHHSLSNVGYTPFKVTFLIRTSQPSWLGYPTYQPTILQ